MLYMYTHRNKIVSHVIHITQYTSSHADVNTRRRQILLKGIDHDMRLLQKQSELIENVNRGLRELALYRSTYDDQQYERKRQHLHEMLSEYNQIPQNVEQSIKHHQLQLLQLS